MTVNTRNETTKATRREWIGLGVLALPCLLYSMDLTVLNLAVPQLAADLKPNAAQLLWIVDIYGFLVAGALITMGTLGDRIGRRKLLMIGAVAFGLTSILAAFSTSADMLILARALLGLSAATLAPSTLSLIRNMFIDPKERTFAIGVWISSFSAGGAIGPLVGGFLLTYFWWGSVFLIAVPVMILLLILAPILLPEFKDAEAGRLDIASAFLASFSVLAMIYGIKHTVTEGFAWLAVAALLLGVASGAIFVLRQRKLDDPLIDMSLFQSRSFTASLTINIFGLFIAFGSFFLIAQYLQLVLGLSPLVAGLLTAPSALGFIGGSMLAPALAARFRPAYVIGGGFAVAALGFLLLAVAQGEGAVPLIVLGFIVLSLGLAPVFTLATDLIIGAAPPERAGSAAGMAETSSEFGGALGIAVLGSLVSLLYQRGMVSLPSGLDEESVSIARDTIGGAMAEALEIGGQAGGDLLAQARDAYSQSFQIANVICAIVAVLAAIVAMKMLSQVRPPAEAVEA